MYKLGEEYRQAHCFPELLLTLFLYSNTSELARRILNAALLYSFGWCVEWGALPLLM